MKRVLMVKLWDKDFYKDAAVKSSVPQFPSLALATIAGAIKERGHEVRIFEYNIYRTYNEADTGFRNLLKHFNPDFVGISFSTPLFDEMKKIAGIVRSFSKKITIVGGGPHVSSYPRESLRNSPLDIGVVGEGDFIFADIIDAKNLGKVGGISHKKGRRVFVTSKDVPFLKDLDKLPYPAWELFDLSKYKTPKHMARKNPVGWIETSRGCLGGCVFCSKCVFGQNFRAKSAERVVDEMEYMLKCGFKEIQIAEDSFTTDIKRAEKICDLIVERGLRFPWATTTGIRVDRVTPRLLRKMKRSGCYRVYFGLESGNDSILKRIRKGTTVEQGRDAVKWAKQAGIEVFGFFMIGLPGETENTMKDTIRFALSLELDFAKMSIMIPLPGTPIYDELKKGGYIKSLDWKKFNYYVTPQDLYTHPNLDWETINRYYKLFYRRFYLRPGFLVKKVFSGLKNRTIIDDARNFLSANW